MNQNITLSLPVDTVRRLEALAAQRGSSISRMLSERVEEILDEDDEYEHARQRTLAVLERGFDLGTNGRITWSRDELHER